MTTVSVPARPGINSERLFYLLMILAIVASVIFGFLRSVFLRPLFPGFEAPAEPLFYIHGAIYFLWLGLLVAQSSLVTGKNLAMHRRLGLTAFGLIPLMVVIGLAAARVAALRPTGFTGIPTPPLQFLYVPILDLLLFTLFASLSLGLRQQPQAHKRLALLAAISFIEPSSARWPIQAALDYPLFSLWIEYLFLVPLVAWDLFSLKRIHWTTLLGVVLILVTGLSRDWVMASAPWLAIARAFTSQ